MSLNIKNEHVHELARQASAATGKTKTGAIEEALELLLKQHGLGPDGTPYDDDVKASEARVDEALDRIRVRLQRGDPDEILTVEDLYDPVTGLPA